MAPGLSPAPAPGVRFCDVHPWGFGWIADSPPWMERASHALLAGVPGEEPGVWLVDPVDFPGLDDRVRALGRAAGVVQLLDRHNRDCALVSARLGVPLWVAPREIPGAPFEVVSVRRRRLWQEAALWWPERRVLIVAEAVGTPRYYRAPGERLGVHPLMRLSPPRLLERYPAEHVLCGHGEGVHGDAAAALRDAFAAARMNGLRVLPRLLTFARR